MVNQHGKSVHLFHEFTSQQSYEAGFPKKTGYPKFEETRHVYPLVMTVTVCELEAMAQSK